MTKLLRFIALVSLLLVPMLEIRACEFAVGYFYQVTALRGQVVGTNFASNFALGLPRWFRQSFAKRNAQLSLYEYVWPPRPINEMQAVRAVETDANGKFDFGILKAGHYTLVVDEGTLCVSCSFDVEVKDLPHATVSVIVDVTPIKPDCSDGHEFIVRTR